MAVNLILFLIVLVVAFIVVRIGAIAFQLTGLEWQIAKFQALSCFSGTGFTTRESELITHNSKRRRIATTLMIMGNAGIVTLIATFANTLRPRVSTTKMIIPYLHLVIPYQLIPAANLIIVILATIVLYNIFTHTRFAKLLTRFLLNKIIKPEAIKSVTIEELIVETGGYSVIGVVITDKSPVANKILNKTGLIKHDISVLAIERERDVIPNPPHHIKILTGDRLICFGKLDNIKQELIAPELV